MKEGTHIANIWFFELFFFVLKTYLYSALPDGTGGSVSSTFFSMLLFYLLPSDGWAVPRLKAPVPKCYQQCGKGTVTSLRITYLSSTPSSGFLHYSAVQDFSLLKGFVLGFLSNSSLPWIMMSRFGDDSTACSEIISAKDLVCSWGNPKECEAHPRMTANFSAFWNLQMTCLCLPILQEQQRFMGFFLPKVWEERCSSILHFFLWKVLIYSMKTWADDGKPYDHHFPQLQVCECWTPGCQELCYSSQVQCLSHSSKGFLWRLPW